MTLRSLLCLAPVLAAAPLAAQVARDTTRLAPIVVTATRTPVPATSLANAVTVLEGDELRRAGVTTVIDALRTVPSLALAQAGSYGAQTSLFLRGGESDYVRVLVDGVPLNQAGGFIDLANLTTENVERIEVVRGPASVLYGSDAMTGVIQIVTRRGHGPAALRGELRGGSYGTTLFGLGAAGAGPVADVSAGVQREATSGSYAFNNGYDNVAASGRAALRPDARTRVSVAARARRSVFHYPTDGAGNAVDSNQVQRSRQAALSLDAARRLSARLELRAMLGLAVSRDSSDDQPDNAADTSGVYAYQGRISTSRRLADVRADLRLGEPLLLTFGAAAEDERERSQNSYQSAFGPGSGTTDVRRTNRALYTQLLAERGWLAVQAGVRLDDNQRFGSFGTWRLGASARLAARTRLRASAGTAFKEPTFGEHYSTGYSNGNPDLRPERTASLEAGLEQSFAAGRLSVAVTGFAQRFRDLIQYTYLTANPSDPNYYNVASARSSGVELEARAQPRGDLGVRAGWTWLRTAAQDSGYDGSVFAPGRPLVRRPAHSGSVSADWQAAPAWRLGARLLVVGRRDDLDFAVFPAARVSLPAYGRLDVWGRVVLERRSALALTVRADNITGTRYEEILGFRAPGRRLLVGAAFGGGH